MESYMDQLSEIVFDQKKLINTRELSLMFDIHISEGQRLLELFAEKNKQRDLLVRYVLSGYKDHDGDAVRLQRFLIVEREDLEEERKNFTQVTGCVIKSVQIKSDDLVETFIASDSDHLDLTKLVRNLSFIQTDLTYRDKYLKQSQASKEKISTSFEKVGDSCSTILKKKEETKPTSTKKGKLAFSKIDKKEFDEQKEKQISQSKKDAFVEKEEESQEQMDVSEEIELSSQKIKSSAITLKRSSNSLHSEDEDFPETKKENKKLNGKPRKRIRPMADSDDESIDEEPQQPKKNEPQKRKESTELTLVKETSRLLTETEEYVDDQGYTVTKQVQKVVKSVDSPVPKLLPKEEKTPLNKKSDNYSPEQSSKTSTKVLPKKSGKGSSLQKGQTQITNFFTKK